MSIRYDVSVDWYVSPRIIEVAAPSVELDIQDLIDTLRYLEYIEPTKTFDHIVDSAGKEALGGGVLVGITLTLVNAKVKFEDRAGPTFVQCNIAGGNLVALDDLGAEMSPVETSDYTQVVRTSSSSATLQELDAIQYSSYQNAVWVDDTSSNAGTEYPIGTREYPVNNLIDAVSIANAKGFSTLRILDSMTLDSGTDLSGFEVIGKSHISTVIVVDPTANSQNMSIRNCNVSGTLDGGTDIFQCMVGDIDYFNGHIHNSGLYGTIYLNGNEEAALIDCFTVDQDNPPLVDMGGSGNDLAVPNYSGLLTIRNLTSDTEEIGVGLNAGMVTLESTISAGTIIISGVGVLLDNSTGTASVNTDSLINNDLIADAVWDEVASDHAIAGTFGDMIARTIGLMQENYYLDNTTYVTYSGIKLLTAGRIRLYSDPASVGTANDVIATYDITAGWTGDELDTYQVVRQ